MLTPIRDLRSVEFTVIAITTMVNSYGPINQMSTWDNLKPYWY